MTVLLYLFAFIGLLVVTCAAALVITALIVTHHYRGEMEKRERDF